MLGPISVHPEQLFLGFINAGEVIQRDILLTKMGRADMKVLEVNHQSPFISTEMAPVENGRKVMMCFHIEALLSVHSSLEGGDRGSTKIRNWIVSNPISQNNP